VCSRGNKAAKGTANRVLSLCCACIYMRLHIQLPASADRGLGMYLALKSIHIIAVVLFLGNITTGIFWKLVADQDGDARAITQALEGILRADRWFTQPGATLILVTGIVMAWLGGYPLSTFWIWAGLVLF